jgi:hypothetical protein
MSITVAMASEDGLAENTQESPGGSPFENDVINIVE